MNQLTIFKIGGKIIDDRPLCEKFIQKISQLGHPYIVVHGGGRTASSLMEKLEIQAQFIEGRRVTDKDTLEIATMVYAGLINKNLVAKHNRYSNRQALGLCGADLQIITASKRLPKPINFGYVGDIKKDGINTKRLIWLIQNDVIPICCAITSDKEGTLLNTNADTIASTLAIALSIQFNLSLVYSFEHRGVLRDIKDPTSNISHISSSNFQSLIDQNIIADGMIPKLQNAIEATKQGVKQVVICHHEDIDKYEERGTIITN